MKNPFSTKKSVNINPLKEQNKNRALTFQEEFQQKQKQIMGGVYFKSATDRYVKSDTRKDIQERVVEQVEKIATNFPGAVVVQPPGDKKWERALEKVTDDYHGDWDEMKDLSRCTLVVSTAREVPGAFEFVKNYFRPENIGVTMLQFHKEKEITPASNPPGYSGYTVFVRAGGANAHKAEIQINCPPMMYAKSLPEFTAAMGQAAKSAMQVRFPTLPGGLGHKMYDVWRAQQQTEKGKAYAAACRLYYDYFRSEPTDLRLGQEALEAVRTLKMPGVLLPPPPVVGPPTAPSWMAASRMAWTQRRS